MSFTASRGTQATHTSKAQESFETLSTGREGGPQPPSEASIALSCRASGHSWEAATKRGQGKAGASAAAAGSLAEVFPVWEEPPATNCWALGMGATARTRKWPQPPGMSSRAFSVLGDPRATSSRLRLQWQRPNRA